MKKAALWSFEEGFCRIFSHNENTLWTDAVHADTVIIPQVLIYASNSTSVRKSLEYSAVLSMDNRCMDRHTEFYFQNRIYYTFVPVAPNLRPVISKYWIYISSFYKHKCS